LNPKSATTFPLDSSMLTAASSPVFRWTTKSVAKVMAKCQSENFKPLATAA
jgi:hypothetical protein